MRNILKILLVLYIIFLMGCVRLPAPQTTATVLPSDTPMLKRAKTTTPKADIIQDESTNKEFCLWFAEANIIRAEYFIGAKNYINFLNEYGEEAIIFSDKEIMYELAEILRNYNPYQRTFIEDWNNLGPHPDAEEMWRIELKSVEVRLMSFENIIEGIKSDNEVLFEKGRTMYYEAQEYGIDSEKQLFELWERCKRGD